jgi:two-component system response regulator NreC
MRDDVCLSTEEGIRVSGMAVNVVIADDHSVVRHGVKSLLQTIPELRVIGEASDGPQAVSMVQQFQPDLLIVDMAMPGMDGLEVTRQVNECCPEVRVIILTIHNDAAVVRQAFLNGASGYMLKDTTPEDLLRGVLDVVGGRRYLSPPLVEMVFDFFINAAQTGTADAFAALTAREKEVFQLAAQGKNNSEVATALNISPRTAETHRANLMRKLSLRTQTDLVRYAIKRGVLHD